MDPIPATQLPENYAAFAKAVAAVAASHGVSQFALTITPPHQLRAVAHHVGGKAEALRHLSDARSGDFVFIVLFDKADLLELVEVEHEGKADAHTPSSSTPNYHRRNVVLNWNK